MNRYFVRKAITAFFFTLVLVAGFVVNVFHNKDSLLEKLNSHQAIESTITEIEANVNENMYGRYQLIDSFGYFQHLMRKNEENNFEVVKDLNGSLHYTYFGVEPKDTLELVEQLSFYKNGIVNDDTKLLYVMTPDKVIEGHTKFPDGMPYNYANETADQFLATLAVNDISFIDLRETILNSGIKPSELFYKTDHHWKVETAFWAFGELVSQMNLRYGQTFEDQEFYTDLANYNTITYKDSFLGSMARKAGRIYTGADDFTLIYPKFLTNYHYEASIQDYDMETSGRFEQSLINIDTLRYQGGIYDVQRDMYGSYLHGNKGIAHITNELNPDGPKIMIIKDSFMIPVASFLSTVCSEVYLVDPRYYNGNILEYTNSITDLDYIMVSFSPQDLTEEFFRFAD